MEFILSFMIISWLFIVMAIWIFKRMYTTYENGKEPPPKKYKRKITKSKGETLVDY